MNVVLFQLFFNLMDYMSSPVIIFSAIVALLTVFVLIIIIVSKCISYYKTGSPSARERFAREQRERERIILEMFYPELAIYNNANYSDRNSPNGEIEYLYPMENSN